MSSIAAVDEQSARSVEVTDVAAGEQAVDRLFGAAAGVSVELDCVADEDAPRCAGRYVPAMLVEQFDDGAGHRPADTIWLGRKVFGVAMVA